MRNLLKRSAKFDIARLVDNGRVMCPVKAHDVDVESCMTCSFLGDVVEARADGSVAEITCKPAMSSLAGFRAM